MAENHIVSSPIIIERRPPIPAPMANIRIIQAVQERLGLPEEKVVTNIKYYGNTSAASIPIALAEGVEKGKVKLGSTALLCGFGAGMTWGGAIVRLREGIC